MVTLIRTDSDNPHFRELVTLLDHDLAIRDGADHAFYDQFNKIDAIKQAVVAYLDETPVACGAIKAFAKDTAEVKRMFVLPEHRGQGIAGVVLTELENWASELGLLELVLETGKAQPEAIRLYQKSGYQVIPNYGQYTGIENSVCMKKSMASVKR
jgi:putative acetyltransferase